MFSELALQHIQNPRNNEPLPDRTHTCAVGSPGEGPFCILALKIQEGIIQKAHYHTNGCPTSIAAASVLCQLITGRTLEQAKSLTEEELKRLLDPIPEGKEDVISRTISALKSGVVFSEKNVDGQPEFIETLKESK